MNECWHCKFVMSGSGEMISVPSVWIRGPDLMIIPLYLRLSLCYIFFCETISKKTPSNKNRRIEAFLLCLTFIFAVLLDVL